MTKEELKQYIDQNVYENQDGDITGEALNDVLKAIVDDGGTKVEANPTGEATTPLTKIKIGETNYNIPQTDTSNLATKQELQQGLSGKQDTIADLQQIRTRADEGHTAVQPSELEEAIDAVNPFAGAVEATDAERLQALANISNQEAGYDSSDPPAFTGKMGYVVLQPEKAGDVTTTFAAQIANKPNTIFEIRDVFDLGGTQETPVSVTIPANCTLKFNGGIIKNCSILFQNTEISENAVFKNVSIGVGSTIRGNVYARCFSSLENDTINLNYLLNSGADNIYLEAVKYHITSNFSVPTNETQDGYEKYNMSGWKFGILLNNVKSNIHWNNAILEQNTTDSDDDGILCLKTCSDLDISNLTIIGEKLKHEGNTGQWNHGISVLWDCHDIRIHDCEIRENYGDGICLVNNSAITSTGDAAETEKAIKSEWRAKNIYIYDNIFGNTIRNNISVICGKNIHIFNNTFNRIDNSKDGQDNSIITDCGARLFVDVEANYNWQKQDDIVIRGNYMYSNEVAVLSTTGGISVKALSANNNIIVDGNVIKNCWYYAISVGTNLNGGNINVTNNKIDTVSKYGAFCLYGAPDKITVSDNVISNANVGDFNANGGSDYYIIRNTSFYNHIGTSNTENSRVINGIFENCTFSKMRNLQLKNVKFLSCTFNNVSDITFDILTTYAQEAAGPDIIDNCSFNGSYYNGNGNDIRFITLNSTRGLQFNNSNINNVIVNYQLIYSSVGTGSSPINITLNNVKIHGCNSLLLSTGSSTTTSVLLRDVVVENINSKNVMSGKGCFVVVESSNANTTFAARNLSVDFSSFIDSTSVDNNLFYFENKSGASLRFSHIKVTSAEDRILTILQRNFNTGKINSLRINENIVFGIFSNTSSNRFNATQLGNGVLFFDTTLNKLITTNNGTWTNMDGTPLVNYTITKSTNNITIDNTETSIEGNKTYIATLKPNDGYTLTGATVTVTMGGDDVTSFVYNSSTGVIYIPSVTGNIVITATANQI